MVKFIKNFLMLALMIALGVGGVLFMKKNKPALEHAENALPARAVEVMTAERAPFAATVLAYGNVQPATVLEARAQVSGKVAFIHPQLKAGGSVPAGEVVVEIDPEDYQTTLTQGEADLSSSRSQLAQLEQEEANLRQSLKVSEQNLRVTQANVKNVQRQTAPVQKNNQYLQNNMALSRQNLNLTRQNLELAKKDLARVKSLGDRRLIPLNQVESQQQQVIQLEQQVVQQQQAIVQMEQQLTQQDQSEAKQDQSVLQQQQQVLQQQQQVTELQGQLRTFASRRASAEAQVRRAQQQVKGQKTTLGRTKVLMPFDARISAVSVEKGSVVSVGGVLFSADNTNGVEIRAEVPLRHMRSLVSSLQGQSVNLNAANAGELLRLLDLTAQVRVVGVADQQPWEARVARLSEAVDPVKRTLAIVVAIDNPYEHVVIGENAPLLKGMYVEVEISAPATNEIVLPRKVVHQGRVYVVDAGQKLEIRPIEIQSQEGETVVVKSGLQAGEQLVVNDLIPVIPGMPLAPQASLPPVNSLQDKVADNEPVAETPPVGEVK